MNQVPFYYYQTEADDAMYQELQTSDKCILKMFCGTGKSLLMYKCKIVRKKKLVVYVFPSLSLIDQFCNDYLFSKKVLRISSDKGATTDPVQIKKFLQKKSCKIICITYQSFSVLLENLEDTKINVCIYDEAHHAVGETYQKLIFENESNVCEKQVFFTATPKNANGIIMHDRTDADVGMCGKLVYDYSYLRGMNEGYLQPFEIRMDMYTENTNKSVFESIARAILTTGNNRVLTFHIDVNTERDRSVRNFVNQEEFKQIFHAVRKREFSGGSNVFRKVKMIALTSSIDPNERASILQAFDQTPDDKIMIISSCETIGEGIDTKRANMCVFVDPKSSKVKIIQNIGRIVRKQFGMDKPNATILIPCWIDKTKYLECEGDREKCNDVIRHEIGEGENGDFNGILNVLSALRQEDEDLYEICLYYPNHFSPQERHSYLNNQGYMVQDIIGDGTFQETVRYLLNGCDDDYFDEDDYCDFDEDEDVHSYAKENNVCIEMHTDSLDTPIEVFNPLCESGTIIRLYKDKNMDSDDDNFTYQPIIKKDKKSKNNDVITPPKREKRLNMKIHTNPDVQVLWNITSGFDVTKEMCSCVIDCELVDKWEERLDNLKQFMKENNKRPNQKSKNDEEKRLGYWLSDQLKYYKNKKGGMKDVARYDVWTTFMNEFKEYIQTVDEIWNSTLDKLKQFMKENNKRPNDCSKNKDEKQLASWINMQLQNYKNKKDGMKDVARYNMWTNFMNEFKQYFPTNDEIWNSHLDKLKQFINENEKTPSSTSKNKDENKLGRWLLRQITNYKNKQYGMTDAVRYDMWTTFMNEYKEYLLTFDEIWNSTLDKLKQFINLNKRRPTKSSKNEEEKRFGNWLSRQLQNYKNKEGGMTDITQYNKWTTFMNEYNEYFQTNDEIWNSTFDKLKQFMNENEGRPIQKSKNEDEKRLGYWLSDQLINYKNKKGGMTDAARYDVWTIFMNEFKEYLLTDDEIWNNTFDKLKQFMNENEKTPSSTSKNKDENKLGLWILHQITNYKNKQYGMTDAARYDVWTTFMNEFKEYIQTVDEIWNSTFDKLKQFMKENERRPSSTSKNEDENMLGLWLLRQITNYKNKQRVMIDTARYDVWTIFMNEFKEYLPTNDEIWNSTLDKLKQFMNENKRRPNPNYNSKNEDEKRLGQWLSQQLSYYKNKKHGMKDVTRYNAFTKFLEEFKQYFDNIECVTTVTTVSETVLSSSSTPPKQKSMKLKTSSSKTKNAVKERKEIIKSEISVLHQKYKTMKSSNLQSEFRENPEKWHHYHQISEENEKSYPEEDIPRNRIIQELSKIKTKRTKMVIDMGCGKAHISEYFASDKRFQFINYDHIACNPSVTTCDISCLPLDEDSVEICILSLAMWGSNCKEYIQEANRILESNGKLYIIEATKRWSEQDDQGNILPEKEACKLKALLEENGFQIVEKSIEKFCLFVCIKL